MKVRWVSGRCVGVGLAMLVTMAGATGSASARPHTLAKPPVVLELFTAQGCAACPQANALLGEFASKKGVLALTFPVDYWDYLGWADTFAKPEFTARQRAYVAKLKLKEVYTPEMVVDGRREARGFDRTKVTSLLADAQTQRRRTPRLQVLAKDKDGRPRRVAIGAAHGAGEVWLVRFDPAERTVKVNAGENKGKTVVEENVVRELVRLGAWSGHARRYAVPAIEKPLDAKEPPLSTAILVQGAKGGAILAAATF